MTHKSDQKKVHEFQSEVFIVQGLEYLIHQIKYYMHKKGDLC